MGLDKSCMDKPYLIGRATALVEKLVSVPIGFVAMVQVNPLQKLTYPLREALKTEDEELMDIAANIGNIPSPFVDAKAQFYVGYYHQKSEIAKCEDRVRIGKRIAEIRQAKGLSIRQLTELCGVSAQNITKIEHGRYNVSIDILGKICEALGYHVDIKPNMDEVIVTKEEMKKIAETIQRVSNKPDVVVKGSSLAEALKERMSRK